MTSGIGTRQEEDGSTKFCDGMKSVPVKNENIEKHIPPFSNEAEDFEEFAARFGLPSNLCNEEDEDDQDEAEEEQETMLGEEAF